jgi:hypothetical protein
MPHNGSGSNGTGDAIPICNGANAGACEEAHEVVKHRMRRPGKMAAPGDPDYVDDIPVAPLDAVAANNGDLLVKGGKHHTPIALH